MYRGERFNSITHLLGTLLALVGAAVLVPLAAQTGGMSRLVAASVYSATLVVLYLCSTLYHSVRHPRAKKVLHVFDHCVIYLLIAGTYTPVTLIVLRGTLGWWLFGIVWTLAILGVLKDIFFHGRYRIASVTLYLLMGWLVVIAFGPLTRALPKEGVTWLIIGGLIYTVGVVFFAMSKRIAYMHGIWHLFVIGGSVCHWIATLHAVTLPQHPQMVSLVA